MKTVARWIGIVLLNIIAIVAIAMPLGGLVFLAAMTIAGATMGLGTLGMASSGAVAMALTALRHGWKIYAGVAVFVFFVMTTFGHQNCCVGMNTFWNHIRHAGSGHWENFIVAVLWPYMLYIVDRGLRGWMLSWPHAVLGTLEYWFITTWQGARMESMDLVGGDEIETTYVTPETLGETLRESIRRTKGENGDREPEKKTGRDDPGGER